MQVRVLIYESRCIDNIVDRFKRINSKNSVVIETNTSQSALKRVVYDWEMKKYDS